MAAGYANKAKRRFPATSATRRNASLTAAGHGGDPKLRREKTKPDINTTIIPIPT